MTQNEWFQGTAWDKETQDLFESKLKNSKNSYNKAEYIRIKASYLLNSGDSFKEFEGIKLMERVIFEYFGETSHVIFAYEQLGDYFAKKEMFTESELSYFNSVSFYKKYGRSGSSGIADVKLAEIIVKSRQLEKFSSMYHLLTDEFKATGGLLLLNEDIFRYYSVLAQITDELKRKEDAKVYAEKALQLSDKREPQLDKYPKLGIIKTNKEQISILKRILNE